MIKHTLLLLPRYGRFAFAVCSMVWCTTSLFAQVIIPDNYLLVAHYPLVSDADDAHGNNPPMELTNTPFQDGGVYVNGIYIGDSDPNRSQVRSPRITPINYYGLAVSASFKVENYVDQQHPVIVGGDLTRWMGIFLNPDSTVSFQVNGASQTKTPAQYRPGDFQTLTMVYDEGKPESRVYLDSTQIGALPGVIEFNDDARILASDGSHGTNFKGILKDMKVWTVPEGTGFGSGPLSASFSIEGLYPNPFANVALLQLRLDRTEQVRISISDMLGRRVVDLFDGSLGPGTHRIRLDAPPLASGIYNVVAQTGSRFESIRAVIAP